jgi:hypothetical protein
VTDVDAIRQRAMGFTSEAAPLGEPIAVHDSLGKVVGWFVPHVEEERLVGFVELTADLRHRRTSSFRRRRNSTEGCPLASSWLDPRQVVQRVRQQLLPSELPGEPVLSFDGVPDRLAWAVPVTGGLRPAIVYVAGDAAWRGTGTTGVGG